MSKEAEKLEQQARVYLEQGNVEKALELFQRSYDLSGNLATLNNISLAYYSMDRVEEAWTRLSLNLGDDVFYNPFSHALAAQILIKLARLPEAKSQVRQAVVDFDQGLKIIRAEGSVDPRHWYEYTVIVMRAAGMVGDDNLVLDLYKRWQRYHVSWENKHLAAVAAFNRRRFTQAASYWSAIHERYASDYAMVALLAERGTIPPFQLDYEEISREEIPTEQSEEEMKRYFSRGSVKMMCLRATLHPEVDKDLSAKMAEAMIINGGEWGKRLGQEFLEFSGVADPVKIAVARALVQLGVYQEEDPIPMVIQGEKRMTKVMQMQIIGRLNQDQAKLFERARVLREQGENEKAREILESLYHGGVFFPPAVMMLANTYRSEERYQEALKLLEILEEIEPDEPAFLFNLAGLWHELDNRRKAKAYLKRIDQSLVDDKFRQMIQSFLEQLSFADKVTKMFYAGDRNRRKEVEEKRIAKDTDLAKGLKNMPSIWLDGVCKQLELSPERLRKDREMQIISYLGIEDNFRQVASRLSEEEKQMLKYLLKNDGWAKLSTIKRKYGSMDQDTYEWNRTCPKSVIGRLWSSALVFVGTDIHEDRGKEKIVSVPIEFRDSLALLLH